MDPDSPYSAPPPATPKECATCAGEGRIVSGRIFEWAGGLEPGRYRDQWKLCPDCEGDGKTRAREFLIVRRQSVPPRDRSTSHVVLTHVAWWQRPLRPE